jgi:hypothetical protein
MLSQYSDWAGRLGFDSRQGQKFALRHIVQIGSGAHPASYPMGTGGFFPGGKAIGVKLTAHFQLGTRLKTCGVVSALPHPPSWRGV